MMHEDTAARLLERAAGLGASFAEIRVEDAVTENITVTNGRVSALTTTRKRGAGIRVLYGGAMGFSATSDLSPQGLEKALLEAYHVAKAVGGGDRRVADAQPAGRLSLGGVKKHPSAAGWEEKLDIAMRAYRRAVELGGQVVTTRYGAYYAATEVYATGGFKASFEKLLVGVSASVVLRENGKTGNGYESVGGTGGLELLQGDMSPEAVAQKAFERAKLHLEASPPPAGEMAVITRPDLTGVFAHESFGHLTEADHVYTGASPLHGRLGEEIASENVTIVDAGWDERGGVRLLADDEGVATRRTVLVERGVLRGYLHSRESAAEMGMEPTGNGRAQDYAHDPIVRMRNTFFEAGDWSEDEIVEDTRHGLILDMPAGGQVQLDGTFTFNAMLGYLIENGERVKPVRDVVLAGNILEMLRYIDAVAGNVEIRTSPFGGCGKGGQHAYVGLGGPTLRAAKLLVGGRK